MVTGKKSANFDRNLDVDKMLKQIKLNMFFLASKYKDDANSIAPRDSSNLILSSRAVVKPFKFTITWGNDTVRYAETRWKVNKKNPQTTKWGDRAVDRFGNVYGKLITEDVVI